MAQAVPEQPAVTDAERELVQALLARLTPRMTRFIPHVPHPKQHLALCLDHVLDVFYGGAGGGGKSDWLLMGALQYVDCPGYAALILRKTFAELTKPGALMDRAHSWLWGKEGARFDGRRNAYVFDTGFGGRPSILQFGHMQTSKDKFDYGSSEFQYIGVDEANEFELDDFTFMFARLRRTGEIVIPRAHRPVPLRMRSSSNPGGLGHYWLKDRYRPDDPRRTPASEGGRVCIPAKLHDNPSIDAAAYVKSLLNLSPVDRMRILEGNWEVVEGGRLLDRSWFTHFRDGFVPDDRVVARIRAWDLAASVDGKRTAGIRMALTVDRRIVIEHVVKGQWLPGPRNAVIKGIADVDGKAWPIVFELEPGSAGIDQRDHMAQLLAGWTVHSIKATGDKITRAGPFSTQAHAGNVILVRGEWNAEYLDELHAAQPGATFLDQLDSSTLGYNWLALRYPDVQLPEVPMIDLARLFPAMGGGRIL